MVLSGAALGTVADLGADEAAKAADCDNCDDRLKEGAAPSVDAASRDGGGRTCVGGGGGVAPFVPRTAAARAGLTCAPNCRPDEMVLSGAALGTVADLGADEAAKAADCDNCDDRLKEGVAPSVGAASRDGGGGVGCLVQLTFGGSARDCGTELCHASAEDGYECW